MLSPGKLRRSWIQPFTSISPAAQCRAICGHLSLKSRANLLRLCPTPSSSPTQGASMLRWQLPCWAGFLLLPSAEKLPRNLASHQSLFCRQKHEGHVDSVLSWETASIFRSLAGLLFWVASFKLENSEVLGFLGKRCYKICQTDALFPLEVTPTNAQHFHHSGASTLL